MASDSKQRSSGPYLTRCFHEPAHGIPPTLSQIPAVAASAGRRPPRPGQDPLPRSSEPRQPLCKIANRVQSTDSPSSPEIPRTRRGTNKAIDEPQASRRKRRGVHRKPWKRTGRAVGTLPGEQADTGRLVNRRQLELTAPTVAEPFDMASGTEKESMLLAERLQPKHRLLQSVAFGSLRHQQHAGPVQ